MSFTIEELVIPATLDGSPAARAFEEATEARNAAEAFVAGTDELSYTAAELLPGWQESPHEPRRLFGARVDGRIVARGCYETRAEGDAAHTAWLQVQVHPEVTGRGIGRALADTVEEIATAEGKEQIHVYAGSRPADGPRLEPPTGFGSLPAAGREVRFLLARGYSLEQIVRGSPCRRVSAPPLGSHRPGPVDRRPRDARDPDEHRRTVGRARRSGRPLDA